MPNMRRYGSLDQVFIQLDGFLKKSAPQRPNPANAISENPLSKQEQRQSIGLMRINHSGEVCAQALYQGQAWFSRNPQLANNLRQAAREEEDHLNWCATRLQELNGRPSHLTPLWYAGALGIGCLASLLGDRYSLSFLAETEHQVSAHLQKHLNLLPSQDLKSQAILKQMKYEEEQHAHHALEQGGVPLPSWVALSMRLSAKIMTSITYWI